ncbi:histidine kinase-like ATPase [Obelidium mucronatum]|nr:histidine kinase-like ATPase [Obelidium mucronatum]
MTLAAEKKRADEAEQSRKQQERYIDMICHEIRNPLNGIQNNNELLSELLKDISNHLKQNSVEDEQIDKILSASANAVSAISHCAKHQKSIADDVLNMSKLSMSLIRISNSTPIDPIALTNTIFDTFRVEAKKKKLDLVLSVKAGLESLMSEYQISSDPARLSQILINLIANSIKFTEKQPIRRITVEIDAFEVKEDDSTTQMLKFGVGDTGIGMTEAEQAHLFQQFSQASYKTYADYGGSGLGLYISKELIILMGGSINVTSKKGVGTTMIFTVKVNKSKKVAVDAVGENNSPNTENTAEGASSEKWAGMTKSIKLNPNTKGKPILVVDDNTINRKVLKAHLERAGFACDEVEDGKQALNKYIANPQKYCLVLMDLEMPVMDGLTSSRLIREEEARLIAANKLEYQVPIMAVTGNARYDPDHAPEHFGMQGGLFLRRFFGMNL